MTSLLRLAFGEPIRVPSYDRLARALRNGQSFYRFDDEGEDGEPTRCVEWLTVRSAGSWRRGRFERRRRQGRRLVVRSEGYDYDPRTQQLTILGSSGDAEFFDGQLVSRGGLSDMNVSTFVDEGGASLEIDGSPAFLRRRDCVEAARASDAEFDAANK